MLKMMEENHVMSVRGERTLTLAASTGSDQSIFMHHIFYINSRCGKINKRT